MWKRFGRSGDKAALTPFSNALTDSIWMLPAVQAGAAGHSGRLVVLVRGHPVLYLFDPRPSGSQRQQDQELSSIFALR